MKQHRLKINKQEVLYFLLLIPFFEPGCIGSFIEYNINTSLYNAIGTVFALGRYLVSCIGFILFIKEFTSRKNSTSTLFNLLIVITLFSTLSNIINKTSLNAILSGAYEIGFICICETLASKGYKKFIHVQLALLGVLSFLGATSILIFPHGFNHAKYTFFAIYFLGSKNASINIYIIFILAYLGYQYEKNKKLSIKGLIILTLFLITGFLTESGSTIVCLIILMAYYALRIVSFDKFSIRPWIPFAGVAFAIVVIYIGTNFNFINSIVTTLGRDLSFSGRTALWDDALSYFRSSPIFGVGIEAKFHNYSGVIQHSAHSQYLDRLAKYGIIAFILFIVVIIRTEKKLCIAKNRNIASVFGLIYTVYVLKMGFDTYDFKLLIMVIYLIEEIIATIDGTVIRNKKNVFLKKY